jgi:hypothetical protein
MLSIIIVMVWQSSGSCSCGWLCYNNGGQHSQPQLHDPLLCQTITIMVDNIVNHNYTTSIIIVMVWQSSGSCSCGWLCCPSLLLWFDRVVGRVVVVDNNNDGQHNQPQLHDPLLCQTITIMVDNITNHNYTTHYSSGSCSCGWLCCPPLLLWFDRVVGRVVVVGYVVQAITIMVDNITNHNYTTHNSVKP